MSMKPNKTLASTQRVMFSLDWNIRELEHLSAKGRNLHVELFALLDKLKGFQF